MPVFEPKNPNYEAVVRDSFARQPFMDFIGAEILTLSPGICEIMLDRRKDLTQQHGFLHGGLVASLADSAAGYAAFSLYPENSTPLTIDMKVNFLNPSDGDHLIARAEVIKEGGRIFHLKGDAYTLKNGMRKHVLTGVFTMMCLLGKSDAPNLGRGGSANG